MKLAILFDRFGPYHIARLRGAMEHAQVLAIEAAPHRAVYDWVPPKLPEGLAYAALTKRAGEEANVPLIEQRLDQLVAPFEPDAIALPGWSNVITLAALRWCVLRGIPAICMSETNAWDFERNAVVETIKRGIVAHYSAGIATNNSQIGYLASLGLSDQKIFRGYNSVDNAYFRDAAAAWRARAELPQAIAASMPGSAQGRYFLASNRFIAKKNLLRLLDAYSQFREGRSDHADDWPLVLLGDGELRGQLEAKIAELNLGAHVHLPGFLQIEDLPQYYGTAGGFVHASTTEQWGLVVNEAMAAGLPVAVSERCGSTEFLIEDGVTGFAFDPHDTSAITKALNALADLPHDTPLIAAAQAKVDELNPSRFGANMANAVEAALARPAAPGFAARIALNMALARVARQERQ